jgi:hypothetical protein
VELFVASFVAFSLSALGMSLGVFLGKRPIEMGCSSVRRAGVGGCAACAGPCRREREGAT